MENKWLQGGMMMRLIGFLAAVLFACSIQVAQSDESMESTPLTPLIAAKYAAFAMLASNAYHNPDRRRFPVELLGWTLVDLESHPTEKATFENGEGLAYDIYEHAGSAEVAFAFRGSDSPKDYLDGNAAIWPWNRQYKLARKEFKSYQDSHPDKVITVVGHSLGGGLALSASVRFGVPAVVFDPSPRVFDGLGDKHKPAERFMIYEDGEVLAKARNRWKAKFLTIVPSKNSYKAEIDFGDGVSRHRSDYLAAGILDMGATVDPTLATVKNALPPP